MKPINIKTRGVSILNLKKLKGKLVEKGKTYNDCATHLGITTNTFNSKINGKTRFYIEEINSLAEFLELTLEEKADIFFDDRFDKNFQRGRW